jgi:cell wall-associated NlpC family hydrolase
VKGEEMSAALSTEPERPQARESERAADFIAAAREMIGRPFKWGGREPDEGFDCRGLITHAAARVGCELPRLAALDDLARAWPLPLSPEAPVDDALLAALDADLRRVTIRSGRPGDVLLLRFPETFLTRAWLHMGIAAKTPAGVWALIHSAALPPYKVEE